MQLLTLVKQHLTPRLIYPITCVWGRIYMTKIGLIGCGMWGRNLARNLAQLDVLTAVADKSTQNAADFAAQFDVEASSVDDLINNPDIAGIVLATAAPSHVDLGVRILEAGKHAYIEKPLALDLDGANAIAAWATPAWPIFGEEGCREAGEEETNF